MLRCVGQERHLTCALERCRHLALVLRAGALPVPLRIAEVRNIGASLGEDSIRQGFLAGALAVVLIVVILLVYYKFSGFLAVCGLGLYVLYTLAEAKKRAVGFKLSEGMAEPVELAKFKFARQKSKLAGEIRGTFFVIKGEY